MAGKILDGQTFGKLTVIDHFDTHKFPNGKTEKKWRCSCSCGRKTYVLTSHLTSGHTSSCGCSNSWTTKKALPARWTKSRSNERIAALA